jgi:tRNA (guanine-N7-)-methyltransferase
MCAQPVPPLDGRKRLSPSPYLNAPRLPAGEALDARHLFGLPAATQVELEIGPGRGGFLVDRLATGPEVRIVGLEIRLKWASLVDQRLHELGLSGRGRVFAEDIRSALPRFAASSCSRVYVHFPDPWWKKRHAKRRLASGGVVSEFARLLQPGGELFVQTDVCETAEAYRLAIESHSAFSPLGDEPGSAFVAENPYGARSPRERRVLADGLPVTRLRYQRLPVPV